jgi:hypothetical protein
MTAAVTIEIARVDDVARVPNAALRFRPTEEILVALGQVPAGRLEPLSPEDREQMRAGVRPEGGGGQTAPSTGSQAGARAAVWVLDQGALRRVGLRTGLSDGTQTAVLEVLEGELAPANATTSSPLLPVGRRGGGPR